VSFFTPLRNLRDTDPLELLVLTNQHDTVVSNGQLIQSAVNSGP